MSSTEFENIAFDLPKNQSNVIKVIGVGGGGSNAIGMFKAFESDPNVKLIGVEAAGSGISSGKHAATIAGGTPGVLHGMKVSVLFIIFCFGYHQIFILSILHIYIYQY